MGISRVFQDYFKAELLEEEIIQEQEKSFDKILQEENARLMQLMAEKPENVNIEKLYKKYYTRMTDNMFFDE